MAGPLAIVILMPLLSAAVRLEGSAVCPAPDRVEERLARILPEAPGPQHVARVDGTGAILVLELATAEGAVLARKELPRRSTCDELAQVSAVIIAAWEARFREGTLVLPEAAPPLPAAPSVSASPPPPATPSVPATPPPLEIPPPPAAPLPPVTPPPSALAGPVAEPSQLAPSLRVRGELGAVAGFSSRWAIGGLARISVGRERWAMVALTLLETPRELTLGEGGVRWSRPLLGAGARWRLLDKGPRLELEGGAAVAWLVLRGTGFARNDTASDIDPAAWAGATLSWRMGSWRPFVGALGLLWLREQRAHVRTSMTSTPTEDPVRGLPRGEVMAVVGLSLPGD